MDANLGIFVEGPNFKYSFQILAQKYSNEAFFVPNSCIFLFPWNLSNRQSRGYWFQISQVFKILAEKYTRQHFWDQIQAFLFLFLQNLTIRQIRECWFQIWQYLFQSLAQKYPNKALFWPNYAFPLKVLISDMTILFPGSSPKIPKSGILGSKFRHFCFLMKFWK